jgi:hypothetical protein
MTATEIKPGVWEMQDGKDIVRAWLDKDGFHSQRCSASNKVKQSAPDKIQFIEHKVESLPYDEVITKCEGQLTLFHG